MTALGMDIVVCDAKTLDGCIKWAEAALATPTADGIMYCTWGDRWNLLAEFGDEMKRINAQRNGKNGNEKR